MSKVRVKCNSCGNVHDLAPDSLCPQCKAPLNLEGVGTLQLYRMGSPIGIAAGYGIYLNGQPFGHLGNKETVRIPLPFGSYDLHCTCGATRRCKDLSFSLTPEAPIVYAKAHLKMGFWSNTIIIETANESEMPKD